MAPWPDLKHFLTFAHLRRRQLEFLRFFSKTDTLSLLSLSNLGMDHYERQRIFKNDELGSMGKERLLRKLIKTNAVEESSLVAFEVNDLIHVAETKRELEELERVIHLFSKKPITDISSLRLGASLLRLYYHLNDSDRAYSLYKNEVGQNLLEDNTCHKILMDLLYKNKQYHEVLEVYKTLPRFNIDCATLAFGAFYHINTAESAQLSIQLLNQLHSNKLSQRALHFAVMLCLNQHMPEEAVKILKLCKENNVTVNLQMISVAQQRKIDDLLAKMMKVKRKSEDLKNPLMTRLYADTMEEARRYVIQAGDQDQRTQYEDLEKELLFNGAISSQTLSTLLDRKLLSERDVHKSAGKRRHIE